MARNPALFRALVLFSMVAAIPAAVHAQHSSGRSVERMAERGPVDALLRNREALQLTDDQLRRLQAIDERVEARNRPMVEQLVRMRGEARSDTLTGKRSRMRDMTPEQREAMRQRIEQARPLLQQIRSNNREAMEEVGQILTAEQKAQVRERVQQRRKQHRERRERRHRGKDRPSQSRDG